MKALTARGWAWIAAALAVAALSAPGVMAALALVPPSRLAAATAVLLALALAVAGVVLLRRRVIRPIARLHQDVRIIAGGDLAHRAAVLGEDEIGELARDVNLMTAALEARLRQHDRLTAVGEMAAGLAHELNNPLQVILAQAGHWDESGTADETREAMRLIEAHARRAGRVVQGLLAFVRARPTERVPARIETVVASTLDLLDRECRAEHVALERRLAPRLPPVRADVAQIEQVLVNLVANALHAAAQGDGARAVVVETRADSDTVVVAVEDSGPGVPPEQRARIFDPFFTTRDEDGGAGLGLSIAAQIANGHGGTLSLTGGSLGGARFELRLPALADAAAPVLPAAAPAGPSAATASAAAAPGQRCLEGLRVLVADDEDAVRNTWARYFVRLGAHVTPAGDGAEALEMIRRHDFDAILLDLKMPRLDGWQVVQATRLERPDLAERIIVVSGDLSGLLDLGTSEHLQPWRLLEKPVELEAIREVVLRVARP